MPTFTNTAAEKSYLAVTGQAMEPGAQRSWYQLLEAYYEGNGLYDVLNNVLGVSGFSTPEIKAIRMPAQRVVDFYADLLWPGDIKEALPIVAANEGTVAAVEQIFKWSNWAQKKQRAARWLALYGDLFIKVEPITGQDSRGKIRPVGVYHRLIEPTWISDVDVDPRGNVIYCRIDMPVTIRVNDEKETRFYTEIWEGADFKIWAEHEAGLDAGQADLGTPDLSGGTEDIGVPYTPIVYSMLRDAGGSRGNGAFAGQVDTIDEVNRKATRLSQMLFRWNKPLIALMANMMDDSGRPLAPPRVGGVTEELDVSDDKDLIKLPGMSKIEALVPNINYTASLAVLDSDMEALREALPELMYYRLMKLGVDLSGTAISRILRPAKARLLEARGNAEAGLVRANKMAITLASKYDLMAGLSVPSLDESGALDHSFASRPVFPVQLTDLADSISKLVASGMPLETALREVANWSDVQMEAMMDDLDDEQERSATNAAAAALNALDNAAAGRMANGAAPDGFGSTILQ